MSYSAPEIEFEFPDYTVNEEDGSVEVCVVLNTAIAEQLIIELEVTDRPASSNPATEGEDFPSDIFPVTFNAGENTTFCVDVAVIDDDIALEGDEQFRVIFSELNGARVGENSESTITIQDDDGKSS